MPRSSHGTRSLVPVHRVISALEDEVVDSAVNSRPAERASINVHQAHDVSYWCQELGCTESELREAVKAVGVMVVDVRYHLAH